MDNNNLKPKSVGGISFNEQPAIGNQQSYQYQGSAPQGGGNSSGPNKSVIICWILGAIAFVLLIVLIVAIVKKNGESDDKKEKTTTEAGTTEENGKTEDKTEADTEENTDEATEAIGSGYEYVAPTAFSGDWKDFQISINGVYYQFPFPYYELEATGWKIDNAPTAIGSGESEYIFAESSVSGYKFQFSVTNPHATSQAPEACLVTGLWLENSCTEDEVKLADNIVFLSSVKQDFLNTFGAPDYAMEGEEIGYGDMEFVSYYTDDGYGSLDLEMDSNKVWYFMSISNMAMPEGLGVNQELPTEEPEINASYVAPTGPSTELTDNIITMDGYNYKLPCPVSEFTKNGWEIDSKSEDYVNANSAIFSALEKDGEKVYCYITNYTDDTIYAQYGMVTMLDVYQEYAGEVDITFPGNIGVGDSGSDFEALYSGYEDYACERDDEYESLSYNVTVPLDGSNEFVYIWVSCDYSTGTILEYSYEYYNYD